VAVTTSPSRKTFTPTKLQYLNLCSKRRIVYSYIASFRAVSKTSTACWPCSPKCIVNYFASFHSLREILEIVLNFLQTFALCIIHFLYFKIYFVPIRRHLIRVRYDQALWGNSMQRRSVIKYWPGNVNNIYMHDDFHQYVSL
jgi:hypothetical protein